MAYDHRIDMKLTRINTQLDSISPDFLAQLSSTELRSLLNGLIVAEGRVRKELANCNGKR